MPKEYARSERLGSQIQRELALLVRHSLKDPRAVQPSILDVEVSRDLSLAKVYFSVLDASDSESTTVALNAASGYLQRELGRLIKARTTPKLLFIYDDTDIRGRSMDELIDSVIAHDKATSKSDDPRDCVDVRAPAGGRPLRPGFPRLSAADPLLACER